MRSKLATFFASVAIFCIGGDHGVIIITESWLVSSVLDSEITPPGWLLPRRDRHSEIDTSALGGGVFLIAGIPSSRPWSCRVTQQRHYGSNWH